ncbi:hypothetical protein [Ramlibacter sp. Leaf400]|uniref:hypothetical protein n=1 Tax=Ramlibacter sp. Leaf400 TaxID=1736365 RepID=UPI0012E3BE60|nr:hypothetical protein [Ramlibacter sp. Leaf400]
MKRAYLGDSYDAVKRLWSATFAEWAPLYAESGFVPKELHSDYERLTRIPLLRDRRPEAYAILNDPDTGVYHPARVSQRVTRSHASLDLICMQLADPSVRCVVTFDQSTLRSPGTPALNQRAAKLAWLKESGLFAFYYASHAPFLFAFGSEHALAQTRRRLEKQGIPGTRFQYAE